MLKAIRQTLNLARRDALAEKSASPLTCQISVKIAFDVFFVLRNRAGGGGRRRFLISLILNINNPYENFFRYPS